MSEGTPVDAATVGPAEAHGWLRRIVMFMTGQTVSLFGSMLVQYAVFWYITLEYQRGDMMTLAAVFGFLPQAIVSIFGGVWADRYNRKALIMVADGAIAVTTLVLALLMLSGYSGVWLIFATLAIRSAGAGVQTPAVSALVPQIVPTRHLMRVNGINGSIQSAMALIAPAAAAALYAWAASASGSSTLALVPIFFIDVVTAALGIGLLALVHVPTLRRGAEQPAGYFADLVDGARYIVRHAFVRWVLFVFAVIFVLMVAPSNLTPLMLVRSFPGATEAQDVANMGILEVSFSVGMLLGGLVIAAWGGGKHRIRLIACSSLLFGALSIAMGLAPHVIVFFALMFLVGLAVPFFSTPSMTLLQETVEPERQGRVFGFVGIVTAVAMPLGMVIFGPLADVVAVESLLIVAGVVTIVVVALALVLPAGRRATRAAHDLVDAPKEPTGA